MVSKLEPVNSETKKNAANESSADTDNQTNEDRLVEVGQNKSREAFIALFEFFAPRLKSFLMKSGTQAEIAEELAQETMLAVWNKAHQFDPRQASASTWIFTIARNKRIDVYRKMSRPEPDPNDPMFIGDAPEEPGEMMDREKEAGIMAEAIKKLPEEQALLIQKSFFEEKTHSTIAQETKIPLGTVKSRIRLAMERLKKDKDIKEICP